MLRENKNVNDNDNGMEAILGEEIEEGNKIFFQIPGLTVVMIAVAFAGIGLPYIMRWELRFGIPAICFVVATLWFLTGCVEYTRNDPKGSPLTTNLRVFVATARNFSKPIPNPNDLFNEDGTHSTSTLRWFDKAAIKLANGQRPNKWKTCSVREVEDTKIGIRMLPMWLTFIVVGMVLSNGTSFYLEQANHLDKKLGRIQITIPFFFLFHNAMSLIFSHFYSLVSMRTKRYTPPIGIGTSMILSVLCCITAAIVETQRLHRINDHGLLDDPEKNIPMSIFALLS